MSNCGAESLSDRFGPKCHAYFSGKEYHKLMSSMQALRDLIEKTEMTQLDMEEQERLDADFVF